MTKLTTSQIYTLRRIASGGVYRLKGNCKKGAECRSTYGGVTDAVNAPSLPVLFRLGLIEFESKLAKDEFKYYNIALTEEGILLTKTAKIEDK